MNEFELIRTFFAAQPVRREEVIVGIGDDAAVVRVPAGQELVITTDTLVSGVHFLPGADPASLGHKALAVNLSDLAAMGAEPAWFTLNLTLPEPDEVWLGGFCEGLYGLARAHRVQLIGGNTARGPLNIAIEAHGLVPQGRALRRSGARTGDAIYVTGTLGDAGLALGHRLGWRVFPETELSSILPRLDRPEPRVKEGVALRGIVSSAIDISDGLISDLGHLLEESHVGARIELASLPLSPVYRAHLGDIGWDTALGAGEDYELCVTVASDRTAELERAMHDLGCRVSRIGEIVSGAGLQIGDAGGRPYRPATSGFDHFRS